MYMDTHTYKRTRCAMAVRSPPPVQFNRCRLCHRRRENNNRYTRARARTKNNIYTSAGSKPSRFFNEQNVNEAPIQHV